MNRSERKKYVRVKTKNKNVLKTRSTNNQYQLGDT